MLREHGQAVGTAEGGMLTRNLGDRNIWLYWGLQALNLGLTKDWRSIDIWIGKIHGLLVSAGDELYRGLETVDDSSYMANGPGEHRRGETAEITRRMRYQHWDDCRDALLRFGSEGTQLSDRSKEMASECSELMKSLPDATTTLRTGC